MKTGERRMVCSPLALPSFSSIVRCPTTTTTTTTTTTAAAVASAAAEGGIAIKSIWHNLR